MKKAVRRPTPAPDLKEPTADYGEIERREMRESSGFRRRPKLLWGADVRHGQADVRTMKNTPVRDVAR
jgi:hypothetical protein